MDLNRETINALIQMYADDEDGYDLISGALKSFCEYHVAIYEMETAKTLLSAKGEDPEKYRQSIQSLDRARTVCHNAVLANVNILNRMAENAKLPLVYEGVVSEVHPYRREVADAVLNYIRNIILERA